MNCDFHLSGSVYNVALKMLMNPSQNEISSQEQRKTINEFNILSQIQYHPNIICLIGSFHCVPSDEMIHFVDESSKHLFSSKLQKKCQFYILEKYEVTLDSIICELNKISIQLCSALLFLYKHKIVHLDMKLDNLMISANNDVQLIDFELARKMNANYEVLSDQTQEVTSLYLSPEVLSAKMEGRNLPCGFQHSWTLGVIMFQMFNKGMLPIKLGHDSFSDYEVDYSSIPERFKSLLSSLLYSQDKRISIFEANEALLQIRY